jgi:hypothetical protein
MRSKVGQFGKAKKSASFLKKRSKKLSVLRALAPAGPAPTVNESFLLLFFKKEALPSLPKPQNSLATPQTSYENIAKNTPNR